MTPSPLDAEVGKLSLVGKPKTTFKDGDELEGAPAHTYLPTFRPTALSRSRTVSKGGRVLSFPPRSTTEQPPTVLTDPTGLWSVGLCASTFGGSARRSWRTGIGSLRYP